MERPHRRLAVLSQHTVVKGLNGTAAIGASFGPQSVAAALSRKEYNWGGNIRYGAAKVALPESLEELRLLVRAAPGAVRAVGRGHSFSPASSVPGGTLVSLAKMAAVLQYDPPGASGGFGSITFEAGASFNDLAAYLRERSPPAALRQVPSPPFITVAGAVATGTHGSGIRNETIASHVTGVELVVADGSVVHYDREKTPEEMRGVVLGLGCHGIVSKMTMQVVPWFDVQVFSFVMALEEFLKMADGVLGMGGGKPLCDSMSTLVDWNAGHVIVRSKHFVPHYDQSLAAESPRYGAHLRVNGWDLRAPRKADLSATAAGVGVRLGEGGSVVAEVAAGSMAAGAGIAPGWVLAAICEAPTIAALDDWLLKATPLEVAKEPGHAAKVFASLPAQDITGPFKPGREPKVSLMFRTEGGASSGGLPATNAVAWQAPWHDNLPIWPLGRACDPGPESEYGNQSEFFIPADRGAEAVRVVHSLARHWSKAEHSKLESSGILGIGELRCIKGDSAWISPTGRDCLSIHISWSGSPSRLQEIQEKVQELETAMAPFQARFHWGKLHTASFYGPKVQELYGEDLKCFRDLVERLDPSGKFRNEWINEVLFGK